LLLAGTLLGMTIIYLVPPAAALAYGARAYSLHRANAGMTR
ncbi:glycosyl transferase, partial [Burkholderia cepacia]